MSRFVVAALSTAVVLPTFLVLLVQWTAWLANLELGDSARGHTVVLAIIIGLFVAPCVGISVDELFPKRRNSDLPP